MQIAYAELHDPTRPANYLQKQVAPGAPEELHLDAVIVSPDRRIAVINGQYLSMGDEIVGSHIVDIQANTVQLDGPGGRITLLLFGKSVKQESTSNK
jgi:MSHA biogenesis protein MshK